MLPPTVRARVSVEAGVAMGWRELVGDAGRSIAIEHFGASADAATLFREFGFTPEAVAAAARDSIASAEGDRAPGVRLPTERRHRRPALTAPTSPAPSCSSPPANEETT